MMKRKPSDLPKMSKPKSVKKTIVINCFTGEEREVDRCKIKIVDGMEIGNTRVELDNGVKLAVARRGKIPHSRQSQRTLGRSGRSTGPADGEYGDGELLGWTPLFSSSCKTLSTKKAVPKSGERKKGETSKATTKKKPVLTAERSALQSSAPISENPNKKGDTSPTAAHTSGSAGKLPPRPKKPKAL